VERTLDYIKRCYIYKIPFHDYDAIYMNQTKRKLKTRIHEYTNDINKRIDSPSIIFNHRLEYDHNFKWDEIKILNNESSHSKRLISEMVHIKKQ